MVINPLRVAGSKTLERDGAFWRELSQLWGRLVD